VTAIADRARAPFQPAIVVAVLSAALIALLLALWLVLVLPFSLLRRQDWTRRNGGKAALGAVLFIVLDLWVVPGNHLHWTPNSAFMPDAMQLLKPAGWSFQTRNYMCDNSF